MIKVIDGHQLLQYWSDGDYTLAVVGIVMAIIAVNLIPAAFLFPFHLCLSLLTFSSLGDSGVIS